MLIIAQYVNSYGEEFFASIVCDELRGEIIEELTTELVDKCGDEIQPENIYFYNSVRLRVEIKKEYVISEY
jgi:hypothetical protein